MVNNTKVIFISVTTELWFAKNFVPLNGQQHRAAREVAKELSCDLLKILYLWMVNNTAGDSPSSSKNVVIC